MQAQRVVIVPGYGLAVAAAQYDIAELVKSLRAKGVDVKYVAVPLLLVACQNSVLHDALHDSHHVRLIPDDGVGLATLLPILRP